MMIGKHMNNEEKLDAIYEMTLENNEILRTIRRQQYFANAIRVLYWLVVLGAIGGAYYFVRPLVVAVSNNTDKVTETYTNLINQLPEKKLINQVVNVMKGKGATSTDTEMPDTGVIDSTNTAQ
jgi:hypothetical protein